MSTLCIGNSIAAAGNTAYRDDRFPDPFADMASLYMPQTMREALYWCEFIALAQGPYREALQRIISYFVTDIEVVSAGTGEESTRLSREEKKKYEDFFNDTLNIREALSVAALDYMVYGNSFTSLIIPFRRSLGCPGCGFEAPLAKIYNEPQYAFKWQSFNFHAKCPQCGYQGKWQRRDRRAAAQDKVRIKRWNPHEIDIIWDPYSDETGYIWKIPEDYRGQLRHGYLHQLDRAPWDVVRTVEANEQLLFDQGVLFHLKEQTLAGVRSKGWGVSRVLTNFRQAWYLQILHRYNEAIALDYIIPFRVITPAPRSGPAGDVNDPVLSLNLGDFRARTMAMIRERGRDPAGWHVLNTPIQYQALGGDATQLAPKDLIDQGLSTLLSAAGIPIDLYNGTMTTQAGPLALRVFEARWISLVMGLNRLLQFVANSVAALMQWEPATVRLQRVTYADDLNRQMARLQLMMGGQLSRTTGLSSVGASFEEEARRKIDEEETEAVLQQEAKERLERSSLMDEMAAPPQDPAAAGAAPGAAPAGAAPAGQPGAAPAGSGGAAGGMTGMNPQSMNVVQRFMMQQPLVPIQPTTPEEMTTTAQNIAGELIALPEGQKNTVLLQLKKENETMHQLVRAELEKIYRDARNQGKDMVLQQQYGKQASLVRKLLG